MKRRIFSITLCILFLAMLFVLPQRTYASVNDRSIRVLLSASGKTSVTVAVKGNYSVGGAAFNGGTLTATLSGGTVTLTHSALGQLASAASVTVVRGENAAYTDGTLSTAGRVYLGNLTFCPNSENTALWVINTLPLKEYVYGAVSGEVGDSSNEEVLKAQAIIAKCFAVVEAQGRASQKFDVYDTTKSQVYVGFQSEKARTLAAVDAVWENTLMYGSNVVKTHYGSYNGGGVITPKTRWGGTTAYEKAYEVKYDPFDLSGSSANVTIPIAAETPHTMPEALYGYLLAQAQGKVSGATDIVAVTAMDGYNTLGNSTRYPAVYAPQNGVKIGLTVKKSDGGTGSCTLDLTFDQIKSGASISASGKVSFVAKVSNGLWHLCWGASNGPRVGLSHRGANEMARLGYSYTDILKFYYPGAKLVDAAGTEIPSTAALDLVSVLEKLGGTAHAPTLLGYGQVNGSDIKLRTGPGTNYAIIAALNTGEQLELYTMSGSWYYAIVIATGKQGYIYSKYVEMTQGTPAPTAAPTAEPTAEPTVEPTAEPTAAPSDPGASTEPTATPSDPGASTEPTTGPTAEPTVTPTPVLTGLRGDVNGDNDITSVDAAAIMRYVVGQQTLDEQQLLRADTNRDGQVTAADAAVILRFVMKLISAM